MSTHCNVGILNPDGTVDAAHVWYDGYTSGVGKNLYLYYRTPTEIRPLVVLGFINQVEARPHACEQTPGGDSMKFASEGSYWEQIRTNGDKAYAHYTYLFKDGEWFYRHLAKDDPKRLAVVAAENEWDEQPVAGTCVVDFSVDPKAINPVDVRDIIIKALESRGVTINRIGKR